MRLQFLFNDFRWFFFCRNSLLRQRFLNFRFRSCMWSSGLVCKSRLWLIDINAYLTVILRQLISKWNLFYWFLCQSLGSIQREFAGNYFTRLIICWPWLWGLIFKCFHSLTNMLRHITLEITCWVGVLSMFPLLSVLCKSIRVFLWIFNLTWANGP